MVSQLFTPGQVDEAVGAGAVLVEVLPEREYTEQHLPGALHIPLRELDERAPTELDRDRAVIVYCWDTACDLSPRAAHRLEHLGFTYVYDYVPGKADWLAQGRPIEGTKADEPTAGSQARPMPTVRLHDPVDALGDGYTAVVDDDRVLHGLIDPSTSSSAERAEDAMRTGPSTFRPDVPIGELAGYMVDHDLAFAPVTTADGVLIGGITQDEAVAAAPELAARGAG